jgi:hypothetical protein
VLRRGREGQSQSSHRLRPALTTSRTPAGRRSCSSGAGGYPAGGPVARRVNVDPTAERAGRSPGPAVMVPLSASSRRRSGSRKPTGNWTRCRPTAGLPNSPAWSDLGVRWRCWFVRLTYPRGTACRCGLSCGRNWQLGRVRASRPDGAQTPVSIAVSGPQGSPT